MTILQFNLPLPLPDFSMDEGDNLYLIVDGSKIPLLSRELMLADIDAYFSAVYSFPPWEQLREVSPFVVEATPSIIDWFTALETADVGYFFSSELEPFDLTHHLVTLAEGITPYGGKVMFKMAHPEGAWVLFEDESPLLWQGISKVWIPVQGEWQVKSHPKNLPSPKAEKLVFTEQQWQSFGDISWRNTQKMIYRHMVKWFPERLGASDNPADWVASWANAAYQKGFGVHSDLLSFFNVLGYLGESAINQPVYPDIYHLIQQPSLMTSSQRIERAAELAEAYAKQGK